MADSGNVSVIRIDRVARSLLWTEERAVTGNKLRRLVGSRRCWGWIPKVSFTFGEAVEVRLLH